MNRCRQGRELLLALVLLILAATANAQPVTQGRVTRDSTVVWRTDSSVPLTTVQSGDILQVTGQSTRWFEVRLPERIAGRGAVGLIARSQLELDPQTPAPPMKVLRGDPPPSPAQVSRTPSPTPTRRAVPRRFPVGVLAVDAATQTKAESFDQVSTFAENAETGEIRTQYSPARGWGVNVAFARNVVGALAFGGAVEAFNRETPGSLTASIPHPFFFGVPRVASIDVPGLDQTQVGLHFQARGLWFVGSHVHVSVGGGPSLFLVKQGFVTDITPVETYPYDTVTIQIVDTSEGSAWGFGFNVNGDVAYYFTRRVGVGAAAQYSQADVTIDGPDGASVEVRAGGLTVGVGLRVRF